MVKQLSPEEWWRRLLTGESPPLPIRQFRHLWGLLPEGPRCKFCNAPYQGIGGPLMRLIGKGPSRLTPQLCRQCHDYAGRYLGGAEIELTMLFADVRGSTSLAEQLGPAEFSKLVSRFFATAGNVFVRSSALVERLIGDQVAGLYVPGFAGPDHRSVAIRAAMELMRAVGYGQAEEPWLPIGAGVHTGVAFLGAVGSDGLATDITVLGDPPNTTSRLASAAAGGEILVSQAAFVPGMGLEDQERRILTLKGKREPITAYAMRGGS
jgi:adenylate cyclase